MNITVKSVLCDDIRREDNGKLLIIGAYDQNLGTERMPIQLRLSLWVSVNGLQGPKHDFSLVMRFPGGNDVRSEGILALDIPNSQASLFFIGFPVQISEYGDIVGVLSFDGAKPIECIRMPVTRINPGAAKEGAATS